jgi:hypothetical protein
VVASVGVVVRVGDVDADVGVTVVVASGVADVAPTVVGAEAAASFTLLIPDRRARRLKRGACANRDICVEDRQCDVEPAASTTYQFLPSLSNTN